MAVTHETAVRSGIADYVVDLIDGGGAAGTLEFQTAASAEVATLTFTYPGAFGSATNGVATAASITPDTGATGGTTTKFVIKSSTPTALINGSVGVTSSGEDIELSSVAIGSGDTVSVSTLTYTAPN